MPGMEELHSSQQHIKNLNQFTTSYINSMRDKIKAVFITL